MPSADERLMMGFPPKGWHKSSLLRLVWGAAFAMLCLYFVGGISGIGYRAYTVNVFVESVSDALGKYDDRAFLASKDSLRAQAAKLSKQAEVRFYIGLYYLEAAERLPERNMYLERAVQEFSIARDLGISPDFKRRAGLYLAGALTELTRYAEALSVLDEAKEFLPKKFPKGSAGHRVLVDYWNARAYLLALMGDSNSTEALELATQAVSSSVVGLGGKMPTSSAAILDTLAESYYANSNPARALKVQRTALALANGSDISTYLKHYDKYEKAAGEK